MAVFLTVVMGLTVFSLSGCGPKGDGGTGEKALKIGYVVGSGGLDDSAYNSSIWNGIQKAADELDGQAVNIAEAKSAEDYVSAVKSLCEVDQCTIVAGGSEIEDAILKLQGEYPDVKFIILDADPNKWADGTGTALGKNVRAIVFGEEQAGFMAGVASALKVSEGELGFIGGVEVPSVQRFNWGFQQGVSFSNENYGTKCSMKAENIVYKGDFTDGDGARKLAGGMYDSGVKLIFEAAGAAGLGVIDAAKEQAAGGNAVWAVGSDVDQFQLGIYDDGTGSDDASAAEGQRSVVLTSALKDLSGAVYGVIQSASDGSFQGGELVRFDVKSGAVGLPKENPNIDSDLQVRLEGIQADILEGNVTVSDREYSLAD